MSGVFGLGLARSLALPGVSEPLPGPAMSENGASGDGGAGIRLLQIHVLGRRQPEAWRRAAFTELDLMRPGGLAAWIEKHQPRAVLHAAAMARPADCEKDPAAAWRVNAESAAEAAAACARIGARMVFCSTDQVFDGSADLYAEDAVRNPIQVYGKTKVAAEDEVLAEGGIVVRLPLLFGPEATPGHMGADQALLEASRRGERIGLFYDEVRAPADAALLAAPIWRLLNAAAGIAAEPNGSNSSQSNHADARIYHLAGADAVSRHQMGQEVCKAAGIPFEHGRMSVAEWAGAPRPPRLVLTCKRAIRELNFQPPDLRQSLARVEALRSQSQFES